MLSLPSVGTGDARTAGFLVPRGIKRHLLGRVLSSSRHEGMKRGALAFLPGSIRPRPSPGATGERLHGPPTMRPVVGSGVLSSLVQQDDIFVDVQSLHCTIDARTSLWYVSPVESRGFIRGKHRAYPI